MLWEAAIFRLTTLENEKDVARKRELKLVVENNRYSYSTPSRCSPAAFQPADLSHLTLGGNSPFALSVSPRPLAAKLLNLEARNHLNLRWEICKRT